MRVLDCWVSSYNAWVSHDPRVSTVLSVLLDSAELLCSEFRLLLSLSEPAPASWSGLRTTFSNDRDSDGDEGHRRKVKGLSPILLIAYDRRQL
jgi:hypothetical protein